METIACTLNLMINTSNITSPTIAASTNLVGFNSIASPAIMCTSSILLYSFPNLIPGKCAHNRQADPKPAFLIHFLLHFPQHPTSYVIVDTSYHFAFFSSIHLMYFFPFLLITQKKDGFCMSGSIFFVHYTYPVFLDV